MNHLSFPCLSPQPQCGHSSLPHLERPPVQADHNHRGDGHPDVHAPLRKALPRPPAPRALGRLLLGVEVQQVAHLYCAQRDMYCATRQIFECM